MPCKFSFLGFNGYRAAEKPSCPLKMYPNSFIFGMTNPSPMATRIVPSLGRIDMGQCRFRVPRTLVLNPPSGSQQAQGPPTARSRELTLRTLEGEGMLAVPGRAQAFHGPVAMLLPEAHTWQGEMP